MISDKQIEKMCKAIGDVPHPDDRLSFSLLMEALVWLAKEDRKKCTKLILRAVSLLRENDV